MWETLGGCLGQDLGGTLPYTPILLARAQSCDHTWLQGRMGNVVLCGRGKWNLVNRWCVFATPANACRVRQVTCRSKASRMYISCEGKGALVPETTYLFEENTRGGHYSAIAGC